MSTNDFPLTVTDNSNGTFTLEWDENHPVTAVMNSWTEEDFHKVIHLGLQEFQLEKADRDARKEFTVEEFDDNFDELFARVEDGETLTIVNTDGQRVMMMPINQLPKINNG